MNEINSSISDIDKDTQKNTAMFEETMAATLVLSEQVQKLSKSVGHFKVLSDEKVSPAAHTAQIAQGQSDEQQRISA